MELKSYLIEKRHLFESLLAVSEEMKLVVDDDKDDAMADFQKQRDKLAWRIQSLDQKATDLPQPLPEQFANITEDIKGLIEEIVHVNTSMTEAVSGKVKNLRLEFKHADVAGKYLKASALS